MLLFTPITRLTQFFIVCVLHTQREKSSPLHMYIHTHTAAESSEWLIASHIATDKQSLCLCGCWLIPSARIARPLCSSTRRLSACPCIHSTSQRSTGRKRPAGGERVPAVFLRRSVLPTTARLCMHETKATENVKGVSSLSRQLRGGRRKRKTKLILSLLSSV